VWRLAKRIIREHNQQMRRNANMPITSPTVLVSREGGGTRLGTKETSAPLVMRGSGVTNPSHEKQPPTQSECWGWTAFSSWQHLCDAVGKRSSCCCLVAVVQLLFF